MEEFEIKMRKKMKDNGYVFDEETSTYVKKPEKSEEKIEEEYDTDL